MQDLDLAGKTALVTGSGRGIGRATALALARCGARLVLTSRSTEDIERVAREIEAGGREAQAIPADVSQEADVRRLFEESWPIDILVNSAGVIQPIGPVGQLDSQQWLYNMSVNLGGTFLTCNYALPGMLSRGWGRIVNISAGVSSGRIATWSAYSSAKAGLETLTKVIARETVGSGVCAHIVRPGIVDTDMQAEIRATPEERFGRENLQKYWGYKEHGMLRDPAEPARLILWALSSEAEGLSGEVLAIDDPQIAGKIGITPRGR